MPTFQKWPQVKTVEGKQAIDAYFFTFSVKSPKKERDTILLPAHHTPYETYEQASTATLTAIYFFLAQESM
jgi:hypothetical protein